MRLRHLAFLSALLVTAACGADDPSASAVPDEISYELFASTRQLDAADLALLSASSDDGTLTFVSEPAGLAGVKAGQVVLAGASEKTPKGLLRFVTNVDRSNGLVLETIQAPLQVAFKRLHARAQRTANPFEDGSSPLVVKDISPLGLKPQLSVAGGRAEQKQSYEIVVFDGDGDTETTNDQVKIEATFGGGFTYDVAVDFDWGIVDALPSTVTECIASISKIVKGEKPSCKPLDLLPEVKTTFRADPFVTLDAKATGAASLSYEKEIEVGAIDLPPFALGPLLFTPSVDVVAKVEGGASARFEVSAYARAEGEMSVVVSSKNAGAPQYNPPKLKSFDAGASEPVLDLHAHAEVSVGARLNVPLYGTAGPYATASGVARIEASPFEDPCFTVNLALEAELGVRLTTPRLPYLGYIIVADAKTGTLTLVEKEVARGQCSAPPDPPKAPGSGPTATMLQNPTFVPWAKALAGDVDNTAAAAPGAFALPDLAPSIDGRYLLGGDFAFALHKIDPDGNVTWLSKLGIPERRNRVLRSAAAADGGIVALLKPEDGSAFVLAKLGQSGAVAWARSYGAPDDCASPTVSGILRDTARGHLIVGKCQPDHGFVVHVDDTGEIVTSRVYEDASASITHPMLGTTVDGEVVLVGEVARANELEWTFVTRLDAEDRPTNSVAFYCPSRLVAQPAAVIPAAGGAVTVVGNANGLGMVARVRKDGTIGFAKFPNVGVGVASSTLMTSVAELGTTGMIVGATAGDVSVTPSSWIVLAGLDSAGSTLWSRRYGLAEAALAFPALRLTDDGGVFVTALGGVPGAESGTAYAMKVFAKDGTLGDGQALVTQPQVLADEPCVTETRPLTPTVRDVAFTSQPTNVSRL